MLVYKIVSNKRKDSKEPIVLTKESILTNWFSHADPFRVGTPVRIRGTAYKGTVQEIIKEYKRVQWEGKKPLFICVKLDDGTKVVCYPSQLKRISSK